MAGKNAGFSESCCRTFDGGYGDGDSLETLKKVSLMDLILAYTKSYLKVMGAEGKVWVTNRGTVEGFVKDKTIINDLQEIARHCTNLWNSISK